MSEKMARKLLVMVTLISLVLLVQAIPGLAETYYLSNLGDRLTPTWSEARNAYPPGSVDLDGNTTTFRAVSDNSPLQGQDWEIPNLACDPTLTTYTPITGTDYWETVKITYTTPQPTNDDPAGLPLFAAYNYYDSSGKLITNKPIISYNMVVTTTAVYQTDPFNDGLPTLNGSYNIYDQLIYLDGSGKDNDGTFFTFAGTLKEVSTDHTHTGYFESFTITYPDAVPTPIPGAVWLLGTGLLGLVCVGRRRKV